MKNLVKDLTRIASERPETRARLVPLLKRAAKMQLHCDPILKQGNFFLPVALIIPPRGNAGYFVESIPKVSPMVETAIRNLHQVLSAGMPSFSAKYKIENPPPRYDVRDNRVHIIVNVWYNGFQITELRKKFPTHHDFYRVFENTLNANGIFVGKFNGDTLEW